MVTRWTRMRTAPLVVWSWRAHCVAVCVRSSRLKNWGSLDSRRCVSVRELPCWVPTHVVLVQFGAL